MTKFKVGDKVRFIEDYSNYRIGDVVEVIGFWSDGIHFAGEYGEGSSLYERVELVELKTNENQRITALENEVAELKLIVHELRERPEVTTIINNLIQGTSTTTVDDIIEFDGQQYRKVGREAREGDVIVLTQEQADATTYVTAGRPYKVFCESNRIFFYVNCGDDYSVYSHLYKRTTENVAVYERIERKPLTPNQRRAEIIEQAKSFVEETENYLKQPQPDRTKGNYIYQELSNIVKFVINEEKRTIVALLYDKYLENKLNGKGIAKCNPSDVFNEHIGEAIALGRALGIDVSEFERAVQPNKVVSGMKIKSTIDWPEAHCGKIYKGDIFDVVSGEVRQHRKQCSVNSAISLNSEIIDDTNAIY